MTSCELLSLRAVVMKGALHCICTKKIFKTHLNSYTTAISAKSEIKIFLGQTVYYDHKLTASIIV